MLGTNKLQTIIRDAIQIHHANEHIILMKLSSTKNTIKSRFIVNEIQTVVLVAARLIRLEPTQKKVAATGQRGRAT